MEKVKAISWLAGGNPHGCNVGIYFTSDEAVAKAAVLFVERRRNMATILIDYENVCATDGLKGVKYLNEKDTVIIFYSQSCEKIRAEYLEAIECSQCSFMAYKLARSGKNALDFYIATECGSLCQKGETQIAIISKDKGFSVIPDFLQMKSELANCMVVVASNIENGLSALNASEDAARRKIIKEKSRQLNLAVEQGRIYANREFTEKIYRVFEGTEYEDRTDGILDFVRKSKEYGAKEIYIGALQRFGRDNGRAIYRRLKDVM